MSIQKVDEEGLLVKIRYDIYRGVKKIKTRAAVAITAVGLILGGGGLSLAMLSTANALSVQWNPVGAYNIAFTCTSGCSGTYPHVMNITSYHSNTGNFSGNGYYVTNNSYTWDLTGSLNNSAISFHILYTGSNPGYIVDGTGTVANDGTLSGTATGPGQTFNWQSTSGAATAASIKDFNAEENLDPSQCALTKKSQHVVDVSFKIINDYDSAVHGNAWANDTIHRQLDIWETSQETGNKFCAIVIDNGQIVTFDGDSPNGTGHVGAGIKGTINGGYLVGPLSGSLVPNPAYSKHGNLGTFDLNCVGTAPGYLCNGTKPSISDYINGWDGNTLTWWGWEYNTCHNGNWVNSSDGNFGDITGSAPTHSNGECHNEKDDNNGHDGHHQGNDGDHGYNDKDRHEGPRE